MKVEKCLKAFAQYVTVAAAILSVTGLSLAQNTERPPTVCSLRFLVVTRFGTPLSYRVARFAPHGGGRDLAAAFRGLNARSLPCGPYDYVLDRTDVRSEAAELRGTVDVQYPNQLIPLTGAAVVVFLGSSELSIDRGGPSKGILAGSLSPPPEVGSNIWVKLQGVFDDSSSLADVDGNGKFILRGVSQGLHSLVVMKGGRILTIVPVLFRGTGPGNVAIQLPPDAVGMIEVGK